jgi:dihydrofolate reductase
MTTPTNARKVVANISLSLDGRTAGVGGEYDMGWIVPHAITNGARDHMIAITSPATTVLLGRKNYQGFGYYWPSVADDVNADPRDRQFAKWLNTVEKIVFSSTLTEPTWNNSRIEKRDPAEVVLELQGQAGGDIIVLASSSIIKRLLQADALDTLSITLCPEIVGGGARLLDDGFPASSWALRKNAAAESGALSLVYDRVRR